MRVNSDSGGLPVGKVALCVGVMLGLLSVRAALRAAPEQTVATLDGISVAAWPANLVTSLPSSPNRVLMRITGLRVTDGPIGQPSIASTAGDRDYIEAELLLHTEILERPDGSRGYRIISSLVHQRVGELLWTRSYEGALHTSRALRLQIDRALNDALIHTVMGQRTHLMVETVHSD